MKKEEQKLFLKCLFAVFYICLILSLITINNEQLSKYYMAVGLFTPMFGAIYMMYRINNDNEEKLAKNEKGERNG